MGLRPSALLARSAGASELIGSNQAVHTRVVLIEAVFDACIDPPAIL
jgi:hypothetical protein